ncbi:hypothetical protein JRQ81_009917 [Phrynocephalus forsythii]|uniref:von Willebrand factor A domain containing 5B1 n=1 Tax=Phrynocephalus forsythii TaxID=171643 RepID=A0A9Q0X9F6_9SAUR|nr:hypothetical protein JRQ81_009917 [Phrynocephalus forsythii]
MEYRIMGLGLAGWLAEANTLTRGILCCNVSLPFSPFRSGPASFLHLWNRVFLRLGLPDLEGGSSGGGGFRGSPRSLCKAVVKGLQNNEPVQWEVVFDIGPLFQRGENKAKEEGKEEEEEEEDLWNETFHHLAARSVIRDFEQLAEREGEIEHGSGRRYHMNAVHTSKACNVISKYTAFLPVDLSNNHYLSTAVEYPAAGPPLKLGSQRSSSSESRRHRALPSGLGSSRSTGSSQDGAEDALHQTNAEENGLSPCSTPSSSGWDRYTFPDALRGKIMTNKRLAQEEGAGMKAEGPSWGSQEKLTFNKTRLLTRAARGFMSKPPARTSEAPLESDSKRADYLPLVRLPLSRVADCLGSQAEDGRAPEKSGEARARRIPLNPHLQQPPMVQQAASPPERTRGRVSPPVWLRTDSPFQLSPSGAPLRQKTLRSLRSRRQTVGEGPSPTAPTSRPGRLAPRLHHGMAPEGMLWATAVALAWLEHQSAAYFTEWELVAAKASGWLSQQELPEGRSLATLKGAARQLFVLLRHWDENLEFNLLCYNPNDV